MIADEEEIHVFRNASFKSLGLCRLLQYEIYSQTMVSRAVFHILLNTPKNFQLQIHLINVLLKSITHLRSTFNASFTQARRWNCDYKKEKEKVTDIRTGAAKLKEDSEADFHGAATNIVNAKLAKDFQSVLKEFQKAQRLAAEREIRYTHVVTKDIPTRGEAKGTGENYALPAIQQYGDQALLLQLVCKKCQRYWTAGGKMRYVLVGAGRHKNKNLASHNNCNVSITSAETDLQHPYGTNLLHILALIQSSANQWHQG
ncbi:hypothetical protein HID58_024881 [Brassica napus]|uniref:Dof-type domain-containing protein n=1 Tax=Brassica napus TaxID=3708 RepID=A0ABQ8CJF4_BRANA|nr:hypothetical protein HID58_024881 [Brassica napus]